MPITHRLGNTQGLAYEDIPARIQEGGKFVVYQYTISLLAVTLRRLTPAFYIAAGEPASKYNTTANRLSLLFGWWCIPWGPMRTIQSLSLNRKGGVDVTKDIMINLSKENYERGIVTLEKFYSPYHTPNKTEEKYLRKSIASFQELHHIDAQIYFALYVNVPDRTEPFFVIGLPGNYCQEGYIRDFKKILYKHFQKNARFEFIDLSDGSELSERLIEMGLVA